MQTLPVRTIHVAFYLFALTLVFMFMSGCKQPEYTPPQGNISESDKPLEYQGVTPGDVLDDKSESVQFNEGSTRNAY